MVQAPQAPKKTTTAASRRNGQEDGEGGGTASGGTGQKVLLSDLQNFLSGLQGTAGDGAAASGRSIDLASSINVEALDEITASEAERSKLLSIQFNIELYI